MAVRKVLVVRFSSIGDIVLTTPVVRCLNTQVPNVEVHYATKAAYAPLLTHNPNIHKVHVLSDNWDEFINPLKAEGIELMIDLHNNLRSRRLSSALNVKAHRFKKLNTEKWLLVNLKTDQLPDRHIVDRYLETCKKLGVENDHAGLDFYTSRDHETAFDVPEYPYIVVAVGGQHTTKKLPLVKLQDLVSNLNCPLVLIGGPEDADVGARIAEGLKHVDNRCGKASITESALLIKNCRLLITHDTGMMHIGAAFKKDIYSIWGNTVPKFGMTPYLPGPNSKMFEVTDLNCRPCSKIGFDKCPKGHFKCMKNQDTSRIADDALVLLREHE